MDRRIAFVAAVGLLVVVGVLYAHLAVVAASRPAATSDLAEAPVARLDPETSARLDRVAKALERVSDGLDALRARTVDSPSAPKTIVMSGGATGPTLAGTGAASSAGAERASGDAPKDDPFPTLSNEDLRLEAMSMGTNQKDTAGSIRRWKALLGRGVTAAERNEAEMQLGYGYFAVNEHDKAAAALRDVVDRAGVDSEQGAEAGRMLSWALYSKQDAHGAIEAAQRVAGSRSAAKWQAANARWVAALSYGQLKDEAAERRELQGIVREYGGDADPNLKWSVEQAQKTLDGMK